MSIFFNEQPIVLNTRLAKLIGLNEAIVLQQIHYWIEINRKADKNFKNGYYWTFNSFEDWKKNNFDFWSEKTIKRVFKKLQDNNFLISDNFNKKGYDRTKWYRINYEKIEKMEKELESLDFPHKDKMTRSDKISVSEEIEKEDKTLESLDFPHKDKMTRWQGQSDPMDKDKVTRPIPENTKENYYRELKSVSQSVTNPVKEQDRQTDKTEYKKLNDLEKYEAYKEIIKSNIDFESLLISKPYEQDQINEFIEIMLDCIVANKEECIYINKTKTSRALVSKKLIEMNYFQFEHAYDQFKSITDKIINKKGYILNCLYNATFEVNGHYTNLVRFDQWNK